LRLPLSQDGVGVVRTIRTNTRANAVRPYKTTKPIGTATNLHNITKGINMKKIIIASLCILLLAPLFSACNTQREPLAHEGFITGEITFDGIPIERLFLECFHEVLGEPVEYYPNFFYSFNGGLHIAPWGNPQPESRKSEVMFIHIELPYANLIKIDGIMLNVSSREEALDLFGTPSSPYWEYSDYYLRYYIIGASIMLSLGFEFDGGSSGYPNIIIQELPYYISDFMTFPE